MSAGSLPCRSSRWGTASWVRLNAVAGYESEYLGRLAREAVLRRGHRVESAPHRRASPLERLSRQAEVPGQHAELRMWDPDAHAERHDVLGFADVQVPRGSVARHQVRTNRVEPAGENTPLSGVRRVEVDPRLGAADRRTRQGELQLHRLGQEGHLFLVQPDTHARSTAGRATLEAVDDQPATGGRLGVIPFERDLGRGAEETLDPLPDRSSICLYRFQ